jgi:hypothetical protein
VIIDVQLSMREHVARDAQAYFFHLRQLRSIRHQLGRDITVKLVVAVVFSRLYYCSAVKDSLPVAKLAVLQRILQAAAFLVNGLRPRDHVRLTLRELHWFELLDFVMRRRSICKWRTKSPLYCHCIERLGMESQVKLLVRRIFSLNCNFSPFMKAEIRLMTPSNAVLI